MCGTLEWRLDPPHFLHSLFVLTTLLLYFPSHPCHSFTTSPLPTSSPTSPLPLPPSSPTSPLPLPTPPYHSLLFLLYPPIIPPSFSSYSYTSQQYIYTSPSSFNFSSTNGGEITLWDLRRRHPVQVFLPGSSSSASPLHGLSRNPIGVSDDSDFLYRASPDLKVRFWSLDSVEAARKRPFAVLDHPISVDASASPSTSPSSSSTAASLGSASSWAVSASSASAAADKDAIPRPIFSRRWKSPGQPSMPLLISLVKDEVVFYRGLW